jgi:hypothetical protein
MARLGRLLVASILGLVAGGAGAPATDVAAGGDLLPGNVLLRKEPGELVERLLREKIFVLDEPGEMVRAYVLFDRPVDRVYALLSETARQGEFRSELGGLATVARLPDGHVDEQHIRILFADVSYRLRYRLDPERRRILWRLDPGSEGRMRRVEGSWELYEMDADRTLGRFATLVDVGDALPAFVEEAVTRKTLPRTLERCRRWVDADGAAP